MRNNPVVQSKRLPWARRGAESTRPSARRNLRYAQYCAVSLLLLALSAQPLPAADAVVPKVQAVALFKGKAVLRIDGKQRVVKVGKPTPEGVELLAADANSARVRIAGEELELRLDGRISGNLKPSTANAIVRLVPGRNGHYFVDGQINGNPVRFLVDTGASSVAINKHTARRIGLQYRVDGQRGLVNTASGTAVAYSVVFDEVKVQALGFRNVRGVVIDGDAPSEALLGQSFLNRLDIVREGAVMELRGR